MLSLEAKTPLVETRLSALETKKNKEIDVTHEMNTELTECRLQALEETSIETRLQAVQVEVRLNAMEANKGDDGDDKVHLTASINSLEARFKAKEEMDGEEKLRRASLEARLVECEVSVGDSYA